MHVLAQVQGVLGSTLPAAAPQESELWEGPRQEDEALWRAALSALSPAQLPVLRESWGVGAARGGGDSSRSGLAEGAPGTWP